MLELNINITQRMLTREKDRIYYNNVKDEGTWYSVPPKTASKTRFYLKLCFQFNAIEKMFFLIFFQTTCNSYMHNNRLKSTNPLDLSRFC